MIKALLLAQLAFSSTMAAFPVFLKQGFSTVLEFENAPKRVVLGDSQSFQVERMEKSLVLRSLTPYATGNLFVFFDSGEPRVFLLTASEDAEPTLFRKFEDLKLPLPSKSGPRKSHSNREGMLIRSSTFDEKKDFLTLEIQISAGRGAALRPVWNKVRLKYKNQSLLPTKLWSERKEVQKDSSLKARFIFAKPNLPRDLKGALLVVPLLGDAHALTAELGRGK